MLAQRIIPELESPEQPALAHDSSTNNLIRRYRTNDSALQSEGEAADVQLGMIGLGRMGANMVRASHARAAISCVVYDM